MWATVHYFDTLLAVLTSPNNNNMPLEQTSVNIRQVYATTIMY